MVVTDLALPLRWVASFVLAVSLGGSVAVSAGASPFQVRALWVSPEGFHSAKAADETLARCERAGINVILANVMCHQKIAFKSAHFAGAVTAGDSFDPLAYLTRAAHAQGIQVQAWSCVYYEGAGKSKEALHSAWLTRSLDGRPFESNFLSPSIPEVNPYLLPILRDLLAYDIDGIHLDYIRYPGTAFDYSDAGRRAFQAEAGFDPLDFLDHAERIVPPEQERFPVRVLHPRAHAEKVWEITALERTLDQAGFGFAYLSEKPDCLAGLRTPSLLIISSYDDVSPEMAQAIEEYVERGGSLLWTEVPGRTLTTMPRLQRLTGIGGSRWLGKRVIALRPDGTNALAKALPTQAFRADSVSAPAVAGGKVIARLESGEPAIVWNEAGQGRVIVLGFHLMKSTSPVVATVARTMVDWLKAEAGVTGRDVLGAKRAQWVTWRAGRVTQLVRDLSTSARERKPSIKISSSGGTAPWEVYACCRDARRWLAEGSNDELFPMNYTPDPSELGEMLELQKACAPAGKARRIYPGLQIYQRRRVDNAWVVEPQDARIVEQQLRLVQQQGYDGFCLFADNHLSDEIVAVVRQFSLPAK